MYKTIGDMIKKDLEDLPESHGTSWVLERLGDNPNGLANMYLAALERITKVERELDACKNRQADAGWWDDYNRIMERQPD